MTEFSRPAATEYTESLAQIFTGGWRQILWAEQQGIPAALGLTTREWVEQRIGGYVKLAIPERREAVTELEEAGLSNVETGAILGVDEATVRRDKDDSANAEPEALSEPDDSANADAPAEPETPPLPVGTFRCIVIDPPWPVEKIERDVRPNQGKHLDYHTWSLQEVRQRVGEVLAEKADAAGCHVYLWTTHRHLPEAFRIFEAWKVRYQCLMTWRKNVGITPYSWMYDTEHVLFGRIGGLKVQEMGLRLSFDAAVGRHSEKPEVFYERVRQASPEPRLDLFARERREGFTPWGNEVAEDETVG